MTSESTAKYHGIVPPLVTPLISRDQLDFDGLHRLLEHVIRGGVSGIFILGTTGEAPSLSYQLRREMISNTIRIVSDRVPVLVGITDTAFVESVSLAQYAQEQGAEAVVLTTPYYFPAGQTELLGYIENIVERMPLPLMLYNMPGLTKVWFEIETLAKLSDLTGIVGVKDSSGDLQYFQRLCGLKETRPDWSILIGPEARLADAIKCGADGGVSGGANVIPEIFVDWYRAIVEQDTVRADECHKIVSQFQEIYEIGKYASRFIKGTKSALSLLHICSDLPADPFHRFFEPERQRVRDILMSMGIVGVQ